jgi:NADH-quinone oxidoreductase subunit J
MTHLLLLLILAFFSMVAVMAKDLLRSAVALGVASVALTLVFYEMAAPWAALFELSVCAGLITVLFVSAINLVRGSESFLVEERHRFWALPGFLVVLGAGLWLFGDHIYPALAPAVDAADSTSAGVLLWGARRFDMVGQICMYLSGVLAIAAFFGPAKRPALDKMPGAVSTGCAPATYEYQEGK